MSIKFVLAIPIFCCVFLVAINAQSQQFDDKKFRDLKARDRYEPLAPMPSQPQDQQPDSQRNRPQSGGNKKILVVGSHTTPRPQSPQQDNQRNRHQNGGNWQSPVVGSQPSSRPQSPQQDSQRNRHQNNRPQDSAHLEPIYYYPNFIRSFQRQEIKQYSNCISTPTMVSCQNQENIRSSDFQMNSLAANNPDRLRPSGI